MKPEVEIQLIVTLPMIIANAGVIIKLFLDRQSADKQRAVLTDKVEEARSTTANLAVKLEAHMAGEDANR